MDCAGRFLCKTVTMRKLRSLWEGIEKCLFASFLAMQLVEHKGHQIDCARAS